MIKKKKNKEFDVVDVKKIKREKFVKIERVFCNHLD